MIKSTFQRPWCSYAIINSRQPSDRFQPSNWSWRWKGECAATWWRKLSSSFSDVIKYCISNFGAQRQWWYEVKILVGHLFQSILNRFLKINGRSRIASDKIYKRPSLNWNSRQRLHFHCQEFICSSEWRLSTKTSMTICSRQLNCKCTRSISESYHFSRLPS